MTNRWGAGEWLLGFACALFIGAVMLMLLYSCARERRCYDSKCPAGMVPVWASSAGCICVVRPADHA
jgi:hypothetical protein